MRSQTRHLSVVIDRPAAEVYDYARDYRNLPAWAAGLASGVRLVAGRWLADSPLGEVEIRFVPVNDLGVLDHDVVLPSGETVTNPLRVLADGAGSEVVFSLRRRPGMSDEDLEADAAAVRADLERLRSLLEKR